MREAGAALIGRHDFAAFQGTGSAIVETVRTLDSLDWSDPGGRDRPLVITLAADGFLRHMVRNIVGTLVDVGMRRWAPEAIGSHPGVPRPGSRRPDGASAGLVPGRGALRRRGCFIMQSVLRLPCWRAVTASIIEV